MGLGPKNLIYKAQDQPVKEIWASSWPKSITEIGKKIVYRWPAGDLRLWEDLERLLCCKYLNRNRKETQPTKTTTIDDSMEMLDKYCGRFLIFLFC